ncbi:MAG: thioredoxin [Bacteroidales bacterium]|nr:thioredoxin [Bacteroidales bacterium]
MTTILIIIIVIVVVFVGLIIYNYYRLKKMPDVKDNPKIVHLTEKNFNQHIKTGISIVDFWAPWCMPCKMMAPVLNELAKTNDDSFKVCKVNIEKYRRLAERYKISSIPTIIIFKNGKAAKRIVGVVTKGKILKELKSV